jgi:hypothetical protein
MKLNICTLVEYAHFPNAFFANLHFRKVPILLQCSFFVEECYIIIGKRRIYYFVCISLNLFQTKVAGLTILICCVVRHYRIYGYKV